MSMTAAHSRITRRWALGMLLLCVCSLQCQRQSVGERKQIPSSVSDARPLVHFVDVTESAGLSRFLQENGHREKPYIVESIGGGVAFLDYDNDGDVDIIVNNLDDRPTLLRNEGGNASHWLSVRLIGTQSSRDPVGAVLTVTAGGKTQTWPVVSGTSFLSANDPRLHIGLGRATQVDHLEVRWPSGRRERFENIQADQRITIEEGRGLYQQNARQQAQ
ncbi:MAG: CRTAC1 family protein [Acidobacteriota bacterium]|nr:CRTAC1 family protein [Blastocatellia bacterium]MDW8241262.1 CRTAC1 family protein [Acidobacteriota bacterium]